MESKGNAKALKEVNEKTDQPIYFDLKLFSVPWQKENALDKKSKCF
jgi:hypothetical protein